MENSGYLKWFMENFDVKFKDDYDLYGEVIPKKVFTENLPFRHPEFLRQEIATLAREGKGEISDEIFDARKSNTDYIFVTVNPDETKLDITDFFHMVSKYVELCFVSEYTYVFEQRGITDGDFNGVHSHIFFKRQRKPSECQKETKRFFKKCVGNGRHIDIKFITKEDYDKVHNYIAGKKIDPSKHAKQMNDILFREKYNLLPIYTNVLRAPVPTC